MYFFASQCTHGPPNSKPCACGCNFGFTVSLTAAIVFSTALAGEDGLLGDVGDGGSSGADAFFTLELRALFGGIVFENCRACDATTI